MAAPRQNPLKKNASGNGRRCRSNPPQGGKRGPPEGGVGVGSEEGGRESGTPAGLASAGIISTHFVRDTPYTCLLRGCYRPQRRRAKLDWPAWPEWSGTWPSTPSTAP